MDDREHAAEADNVAQAAMLRFLYVVRTAMTGEELAEVGDAFTNWQRAEDEFERVAEGWLWMYPEKAVAWLVARQPSVTWESLTSRLAS